ncbi:hypothetical protein AB834_03160 [PVC group bacterium (ex Bugula neritina AB1)]|nr:hypothetical protein AB834_03160 [PVC group bacterium (ex Bugula neritina AB1)]
MIKLQNKELVFDYFHNGASSKIMAKDIMLNQVCGNPVDGNINNIYLRVYKGKDYLFSPLLGNTKKTTVTFSERQACWKGSFEGISYECQLVIDQEKAAWQWEVSLSNNSSNEVEVDLIYAQDLGLSTEGAVRVNEAYSSQYIDHYVFEDELGYTVASRQNQQTPQGHPLLVQGCLQKTVGYVTDGFDFYGLNYKKTGIPDALTSPKLLSEKKQYEFAFVGLQSESFLLAKEEKKSLTFFAEIKFDHPEATKEKDFAFVQKARDEASTRSEKKDGESFENVPPSIFGDLKMLNGESLSEDDLNQFFPGEHRHVEKTGSKTLSFFYGNHHHVVLGEKELLCERPHGHIMLSGKNLDPGNDHILSTTNYMYGLFHSHATIGNTSFNKFLAITRSPLNIFKSSGQRIFVQNNGQWEMLGLPSAYEISPSLTRWIYKLNMATICVEAWVSPHSSSCYLKIKSTEPLEFLISNQHTVGNNEWENTAIAEIDRDKSLVKISCSSDCLLKNTYPEATFYIGSSTPDKVEFIRAMCPLNGDEKSDRLPYIMFRSKKTQDFGLILTGDLFSSEKAEQKANEDVQGKGLLQEEDYVSNMSFWSKDLGQKFSLKLENSDEVSKLDDIIFWYFHNAIIHYLAPHGLEQFSGAAWGVRDVCQGPLELLLSMGHTDSVKNILRKIFRQQYFQTADWPQWFMFDRYFKIQHAESHGDIIVWPLYALGQYIEKSNDFDFLQELLSFIDNKTFEEVDHQCSVLEHIEKIVDAIESKFISGTHLSSYGEGDWDDTLQPANESLRARMVSSWTVSLTYQAFGKLEQALSRSKYESFAKRLSSLRASIKKDFNEHLVKDDVVSGFAYFQEKGDVETMIHPSDQKLGLKYRLLPMIRSIISELFEPEQTKSHLKLIEKHLSFPDGVHLMDQPVNYKGGPRLYFRRADEAANFGREVGTQYIHAHIRYIEAMCKIGSSKKAYEAIFQIIPINIKEHVPNASIRQSNAYFSSSDGDFKDRYAAQDHFSSLKKGDVNVKGGWRIYSSGPGIFINQVISNFFGVRPFFDKWIIDPVLPVSMDRVTLTHCIENFEVEFRFHIKKGKEQGVQKITVNNKPCETSREKNPYRLGGLSIKREALRSELQAGKNVIDVFLNDSETY